MSVEVIQGTRGATYQVRWRPLEGPAKMRRFKDEQKAELFDEGVKALTALQRAEQRWEALSTTERRWVREQVNPAT
jgi:hypothetical protein